MSEIWQMKDAFLYPLAWGQASSSLMASLTLTRICLCSLYKHKIGTYILYIQKEKDKYYIESAIDSISLENSNTRLETHMSSDEPYISQKSALGYL